METKRTNKTILAKGIQRMAMALLFMFISPVIIHSAFQNQEHPLYIPILILGIAGAIFAIAMAFVGLNTIMKSLFDKNKKQ
ncbi:DUF6095 family protein [Aquimarina brevivitae]|uniref:Uncharacterized protein n=1 Tax=Aquimarina brevivitae TaxID=323412 RepID=A0A4Q7P1X1_9FLAO|nr:DUF6095 family protein [Aquimarina brevivitae]RZS92642.1 hypothetical protein EV197_2780 [Aquimarina brevivitae]